MPRPVEIDRDQALQEAMQLFWRQGYHQTSVRDLTSATRLKPGSLYGAFSNKRTLFLRALEYYAKSLHAAVDETLRDNRPPLERIALFFDKLLKAAAEDPDNKGCLLVNTLLETPPEEQEIVQHATAGLRHVERRFVEVLQEAADEGSLREGIDAEGAARMLMTTIFGLRVYARMEPDGQVAKTIVRQVLVGLQRA